MSDNISALESARIAQLENALRSALAHFYVSSVTWAVVYDNGLSVEGLRELVVIAGDVPGFPAAQPNECTVRHP